MRTEAQLQENVQRFQANFWNKERAERPLIGIYDERVYMPINFLRRPFSRPTVTPDDISEDRLMTEYEYSFANRPVSCDDFVAFSAPWRGVPWLEACCDARCAIPKAPSPRPTSSKHQKIWLTCPFLLPMRGLTACGVKRSDCRRSGLPIAGSAPPSFVGVPMSYPLCGG